MSIRRLMLVFAHVCVAQLLVGSVASLCKTIFEKTNINSAKPCFSDVIVYGNHQALLKGMIY